MQEAILTFYKMSGSGNDFILVDNREGIVDERNLSRFVASVCRRKLSVGADGMILIEASGQADFKWRFFNADGGEAEMCGNGGRCAARLAYLKGIAGPRLSFETKSGVIRAEVTGDRVKLEMPQPTATELDYPLKVEEDTLTVSSITVGVPHVVIWVTDLETSPVFKVGRAIRYHQRYTPAGTNVNFVKRLNDGSFAIRTYERGVEDETLACGTGSVATALIAATKGMATSPSVLHTRGGEALKVYFDRSGDDFRNVFLEGEARVIYEGRLWKEAT
ncbi:MAG: diaminopimelate epimerase [Deltaproteobacteria bacterium]|nr:diaminopimelate epimerase [Deltaproteobacteria bacterium]MBW2020429.1 diaminopimelate epimerase [Deltaproteobacteria bacterium]MBW2075173.1 diaminopimelate epimerase [Deltaproteobacteria bacterium]RLB81385.1 MAG: diaminopimelate epimerase [Deltaproteobacteria bacterium]